MIVTCPNCQTKYNLPDDRIPDKGTKVKCSRCSQVFKVDPPAPMVEEEVENLLEEEPTATAASKAASSPASEETDEAFDQAFDEMAGSEVADEEPPADPEEHGGDVFADDDAPAGDFDSLFDEPAGSADDVPTPDESEEDNGENFDDLFGDDDDSTPTESAASPSPEDVQDDLSDLFGEGEEDPAATSAEEPGQSQEAFDDIFAAEKSAPAPGADLEESLFNEDSEAESKAEALFGDGDRSSEEAESAAIETDFDLDDEQEKGGKGKWLAIVIILLLAVGIGAGWYFKAWKFFGIDPANSFKDVPVIGALFDDGAAEDTSLSPEEKIKHIELKNVRQYYVQNEKAGLVFVVQGEAVNAFDTPRERIEVEVFLYDANGNVLTSQRIMAGNTLSMFQLRVQSQKEIEDGLASEVGILSNNTFLRPSASTPFMAAIFNAPVDQVKEFGVKVVDVQKPE